MSLIPPAEEDFQGQVVYLSFLLIPINFRNKCSSYNMVIHFHSRNINLSQGLLKWGIGWIQLESLFTLVKDWPSSQRKWIIQKRKQSSHLSLVKPKFSHEQKTSQFLVNIVYSWSLWILWMWFQVSALCKQRDFVKHFEIRVVAKPRIFLI